MDRTKREGPVSNATNFESLIDRYYPALYRFAFSLTHKEPDARDLTQQTFYIWATKGHQLADRAKVKSWLFTTLHREFLQAHRKEVRFAHCELAEACEQLPQINAEVTNQLDSLGAVRALSELPPLYRAPVALFYLEDYSYKEIAEILGIPLGTVKSRMARGIAQLQAVLLKTSKGEAVKKTPS